MTRRHIAMNDNNSAKDSDKDSVSSSSPSSSKSPYLLPKPDPATGPSTMNSSVSPASSSGGTPSSSSVALDTGQAGLKTQAAFVNKLFSMVEDESIQDLISWSPTGDVFSVTNPTEFSKTVLPQYFKHNNWQSFVRQLNMYGFHKVNDMFHANPSGDNQAWEFKHPEFKRGAADLLQNIKRKSSKPSSVQGSKASVTANMNTIEDMDRDDRADVLAKQLQEVMDRMKHMERTCEGLFSETMLMKSVQTRQQQIITNVANLLDSMARDCDERDPRVNKRKYDIDLLQQEIAKLSTDSMVFNHPPTSTYGRPQYNGVYPPNHTLVSSPMSTNSNNSSDHTYGAESRGSSNGSDNPASGNAGNPRYASSQYAVLPPLNISSAYNSSDGGYMRRRPSSDGIGHNPNGHDTYRHPGMPGMRPGHAADTVYHNVSPPTQPVSVTKTASSMYRTSSVSMSFGRESNLLNPMSDSRGQNGVLQQRKIPSPGQETQDTAKRRRL